MRTERILRILSALLVLTALLLSACGGGEAETATPTASSAGSSGGGAAPSNDDGDDGGNEDTTAAPEPTNTLSPAEQFPEDLALHPEATNIEVSPASNTYVYIVPMMVRETSDYLLQELENLGWEKLGQPTLMGHLATLNMQMDSRRLSISMQDNERSQTTRVQMLLIE